jgi:AcrR family transcriptional regulator
MPAASTRKPRARGRRPGENQTRQAILEAARAEFSKQGLNASLRSIARAANVDPALPLHYYGSKDRLFVAAMEWPFDFDEAVDQIVSGRKSELGLRLARFFISIWGDPGSREPIAGLLRASTTNEQAGRLLRESIGDRLLGEVGRRLADREAPLRMSLCASQLVGLGVARYIVGLEPLASLSAEDAAQAIAPTLQRYLTGPLPRTRSARAIR